MFSSKASLSCCPSETDRDDSGSFTAAGGCGAVNTQAGSDSEIKLMFGVKGNEVTDNGALGIGSELTVVVKIACEAVDGSASEISVLEFAENKKYI